MDLDSIYAPVRADLTAVHGMLRDELSSDDAFIGELVGHVLTTRGKMIRPALTCLSALAGGGGGAARLPLACAVEMIHVASLIHDDVIDAADLRRGQASVNAVWGNQVAVLLGDYLFSKAFFLLARLHDPEIAAAMAWATVRMSRAEIKQIKAGDMPHTDETIYFDIIDGKTAQLMSAACRCGALTARAPEAWAGALSAFGREWGMAFQITDDALDLTATSDRLGKPIGSDIQTGKVTLPVIHALRHAPEIDRRRLAEIVTRSDGDRLDGPFGPHGSQSGIEDVHEILIRSGAIDHALAVADSHAGMAAAALDPIPESPARTSLLALAHVVTARAR
jgi:octaprenyl-diphosphate synthase